MKHILDTEVRRHMPMVQKIASKMHRRLPLHVDIDDLVSAGSRGLLRAFERYDAGRGWKFSTFAVHWIRGAICDEVRRMDHASRWLRLSGAAPIQYQLKQSTIRTLVDYREQDPEIIAEWRDEVRCLFDRVSPREREILRLYYLEEVPMSAIGRRLGISESRVSQIHAELRVRLTGKDLK